MVRKQTSSMVHGSVVLALALILLVASALPARAVGSIPSGVAASRTKMPEAGVREAFSCTSVTEIPLAECEALVALYNSTNGAVWGEYTKWLVINTPCSWAGVSCKNGHVSSLGLNSDHLSGTIPAELGNLAQLTSLNLGWNQLTGSLPPQLVNLTNLTYLDLGSNQLTGSLPPQLGNLTNLTHLALGSNQLSGSLPPELGKLTQLEYLLLSDNHFSGAIPPELGDLQQLKTLVLANNLQLSGNIPPELSALANLGDLDLSGNLLSGGIPAWLGSMPALYVLNLSNNPLGGTIPPELGDLPLLSDLRLSGDHLTGSIPAQVWNLTNLQTLELDHNHLTGSLSSAVSNLSRLFYLYLDSNPMSGELPTSLTSLAYLFNFTFDCQLTATDPDLIAWLEYHAANSFGPNIKRCSMSPNDDFDAALALTALPYDSGRLTVRWLTNAADDPALPCYSDRILGTSWFKFTPDFTGALTLDTYPDGTTGAFITAVWTGTRGHLVNAGCNPDQHNPLSVNVTAGTPYTIETAYYGNFEIKTDPILDLKASRTLTISGSTGVPFVEVEYSNGATSPKVKADDSGYYIIPVSPGWSGTVTPDNDYTFTPKSRAYADLQANAPDQNYKPVTRTLTIKKTGLGSGLVVSVRNGIDCGSTCAYAYPYNKAYPDVNMVNLLAAPSAGSIFTGWSGGGCSGVGSCLVDLSGSNKTVTANFKASASYTLSVTKTGVRGPLATVTSNINGITCGKVCASAFPPGAVVTLSADPVHADTRFTGWSGGGCSGTGTCTLTITAATSVSANFKSVSLPALMVTKSGPGLGTVTSDPSGIACGVGCTATFDVNTSVFLTASPFPGSLFAGWESDSCNGTGPCQLLMNDDKSLRARFVLDPSYPPLHLPLVLR